MFQQCGRNAFTTNDTVVVQLDTCTSKTQVFSASFMGKCVPLQYFVTPIQIFANLEVDVTKKRLTCAFPRVKI